MTRHQKPIIINVNQVAMANEFEANERTQGLTVLDVDGDLQYCALMGPNQYRWINLGNGNRWDDDSDSTIMGYAANITIQHEEAG